MQDQLTFIETQFPVSKVSKESYKERLAGSSQTLTGLGKWWGRKPLVMVRATILGLLMPASDDPEKDREIFLKLMTMDSDGLWQRYLAKDSKISAKKVYEILTDDEHKERVEKKIKEFGHHIPQELFENKELTANYLVDEYFITKNNSIRWAKFSKENSEKIKDGLTRIAFEALYYDEKLFYCVRPEQIEGPSKKAWEEINAHLGTSASSLQEIVDELGKRRFGHTPRVGDAFCGGGSIPFEAARLGCDVYASDLNPVAALLTWAAINIVGGGPEVAEQVKKAQQEIYDAVDKQVTEWGIEHNDKGHRADAYLYCVEVKDPETGWMVPLAPSWVIGEKTKTVAILKPDKKNKRYDIEIKMNASAAEMRTAKEGTVKGNYVIHPNNENQIPMSMIRRENEGGLRMWENDDIVPRPDDVYQERLYCIRWVHEFYKLKSGKNWKLLSKHEAEALDDFENLLQSGDLKLDSERYYASVTKDDLKSEEKALTLLRERFIEWQKEGYIPSRRIEPGDKTDEPIRNRGWTHWHHLFNARQLLVNGLFSVKSTNLLYSLIGLGGSVDRSSRACIWDHGSEKIIFVFYNQALNTLYNYGTRSLPALKKVFILQKQGLKGNFKINNTVLTKSVATTNNQNFIWITDPPYADAVNYHELSEFFLSWYEKHLPEYFPEWAVDSRRSLAIQGSEESFKRSMVEAYRNLTNNMPDNGMQVVMFTHQDAAVWADLAIILWGAGLHVTAAWTIATETTSALKDGNYVQGTVLLILRKNISAETAFLDEMVPRIEQEVKAQVESMEKIEDKEEPNFSDTDYQLAAYAAALRVITGYKQIEDIDIERELSRTSSEKSPLEDIIENARNVAAAIRIPEGLDSSLWKSLSPEERYYLRGLDFESKSENKSGAFQELARNYGVREYQELLGNVQANSTRVKTAEEFGTSQMSGNEGFDRSILRHLLYSIHTSLKDENPENGRNYLKTEMGSTYWAQRQTMIALLQYMARFEHSIKHRAEEFKMATLLAGLLQNDSG